MSEQNNYPIVLTSYRLQKAKLTKCDDIVGRGLDRLEEDKWAKANRLFEEGITLSNQDKPDEAEISYLAGLKICPEHSGIHNNLGCIYYTLKEYEKASNEFLRTIEIDCENIWAHSNLGLVYEIWAKYPEAEHEFKVAVELSPNSFKTHYYLAKHYDDKLFKHNIYEYYNDSNEYVYSNNNVQYKNMDIIRLKAIEEYNCCLKLVDETDENKLKEIKLKLKTLGKPIEDILYEKINRILITCEKDPEYNFYNEKHNATITEIIKNAYYLGALPEVIRRLKNMIATYDKEGDKYRVYADMAYRIGMYANDAKDYLTNGSDQSKAFDMMAIEFWKISVDKSGETHSHGLSELRQTFSDLGLYDDGISLFSKYEKLADSRSIKLLTIDKYLSIADVALNNCKHEEAINALNNARGINDEYRKAVTYINLSAAYARLDKKQEAKNALLEGIKKYSSNEMYGLYHRLSLSYFASNEQEEIKYLEKYIELMPSWEKDHEPEKVKAVYNKLAEIYKKQGYNDVCQKYSKLADSIKIKEK